LALPAFSHTFQIALDGATALRSLVGKKAGKAKGRDPVALSRGGSHVFAKARGVTLALRCVEAQFPPYSQVIPASSAQIVTCNRALLAEVVDAIGPCANARTGALTLSLSGTRLTVATHAATEGEAREALDVTRKGSRSDFAIGVNFRYLKDALASIDEGEVTLSFSDALDPIVLRAKDGSVNVVMPFRIK
jgi:DNA polymerase-3 subunit beta